MDPQDQFVTSVLIGKAALLDNSLKTERMNAN